jgi:hypothetical protein
MRSRVTNMLVARLPQPTGSPCARVVLLLGVLLEEDLLGANDLADQVRDTIRSRIDAYLALLQGTPSREDVLALLFLLAHFPADRARILSALATHEVSPDDFSRLCRCLERPDFSPDTPVGVITQLGRSWPSPAAVDAAASSAGSSDDGWVSALELTMDRAAHLWDLETRALLAYSGAKALHATETAHRA